MSTETGYRNTDGGYRSDLVPSSRADSFLERLAEKLGGAAHASVIFSAPVEHQGVKVIPVAKARWGFGGGGGQNAEQSGSGGGGGVIVSPVGYIELENGESRFRPIWDPGARLPVLVAGGVLTMLLLRVLARLTRS